MANGSSSSPVSPALSGGLLPSPSSSSSSSSSCSTNTNTLSASPPPPPLPSPGASGGSAGATAPAGSEKDAVRCTPGAPATETAVPAAAAAVEVEESRERRPEGSDVLAGMASRGTPGQPAPAAESGDALSATCRESAPKRLNGDVDARGSDTPAAAAAVEARAASQSSLPGAGDNQATAPLVDESEQAIATVAASPPPPPPRRAFFATSSSDPNGAGSSSSPPAARRGKNSVPAGFILSGVKEGADQEGRFAAMGGASSLDGAARTRSSGVVNGDGGGGYAADAGKSRNDEDGSSTERLSRQVESLLARVEFLEKRRAFEGVGWGPGGASRGGSGAIVNSRKGSEVGFLSEGPGSEGALLVTPPPRIGARHGSGDYTRHGSGDLQHALGVSTTPFTGLDVLFRTPKVRGG